MAMTAGSNAGQSYSEINMTPLIERPKDRRRPLSGQHDLQRGSGNEIAVAVSRATVQRAH